jgi:amino acid transporter
MIFNPAITAAVIGIVDLPTVVNSANNILSVVGERAGGGALRTLVTIDAISVLCGGILTAYVGVIGQIKQLASDRCFPAFLLKTNRYGAYHYIILSFCLLCIALYLVTGGDVAIIAGLFAVSFLMVMLSFAYANMKLKYCRPRLPRSVESTWRSTAFGAAAMLLGLIGNCYHEINLLFYFLIFLALFIGFIMVRWSIAMKYEVQQKKHRPWCIALFFVVGYQVSFNKSKITKIVLYFLSLSPYLEARYAPFLRISLIRMQRHTALFFSKSSELHILNKAIIYVRDNELLDRFVICHVHRPARSKPLHPHGPHV